MSKKIVLFSTLAVFALCAFAVFAEEIPEGVKQGPSAEEIEQFKNEFGAPPESFPEPEVSRPQFEEPGKIAEEIKQYATDEELVPIYCAMVRYKTGKFFMAMDALKQNLIPAVENAKNSGIEIEIPDIEAIKSEGQAKIDEICKAVTVDEADQLIREFSKWGQEDVEKKFSGMKSSIQEQMKKKGDELKKEVTSAVEEIVSVEKAKIESELKAEADRIVEEKVAQLEASKSKDIDVDAVKAEIQAKVEAIATVKKAQLQSKIQAKIDEIIGEKKAKFEAIGNAFNGMESKINTALSVDDPQYDKYKEEAFRLRKELALRILDKNIEEGIKQLTNASSEIDEARKEDPTIRTAGDIKAEIIADRKILEEQLDQALKNEDETAFQKALNDFRLKWENYRAEAEKSATQSANKICTIALAQFGKAKEQMNPGMDKIKSIKAKCQNSVTDECLKINEFSSRFDTIIAKGSDLNIEMTLAEKICQNPDTADRANLIALMKKIQRDGEDLRVYGEALEAQKKEAVAKSLDDACAQVIPKLDAARSELEGEDVVSLNNQLEKCSSSDSEECQAVKQLSEKIRDVRKTIVSFTGKIDEMVNICRNGGNESDLSKLRSKLEMIDQEGNALRVAVKDLRADATEKASEKAFCRAIVPGFNLAKTNISTQLRNIRELQSSCEGKSDDRCLKIKEINEKIGEINRRTEKVFNGITEIETVCQTASNNTPGNSFVEKANQLKNEEIEINEMVGSLLSL